MSSEELFSDLQSIRASMRTVAAAALAITRFLHIVKSRIMVNRFILLSSSQIYSFAIDFDGEISIREIIIKIIMKEGNHENIFGRIIDPYFCEHDHSFPLQKRDTHVWR
jgi:hypothetical protein